MGEIIQSKKDGKLYEIDHEGQLKCLESPREYLIQHTTPFSLEKAIEFLMKLRDAKTVKEAASHAGLETKDIHSWRRLYPDFAKRMEEALEDRAYYFEDRIMEVLDDPDIASNELTAKVAAYEKLAKYGNRARYSDRYKEDVDSGVTFIINTGVPDQVPIDITKVVNYEPENKAYPSDGTKQLDSVQDTGSGGNGYSEEWYSSDGNKEPERAGGRGDGGDSGRESSDSERGSTPSPEQELFDGGGSAFTRRGGGEE